MSQSWLWTWGAPFQAEGLDHRLCSGDLPASLLPASLPEGNVVLRFGGQMGQLAGFQDLVKARVLPCDLLYWRCLTSITGLHSEL